MRSLSILAFAQLALLGCEEAKIDGPITFGNGQVASVEQLKDGYDAYQQYCRPCHGDKGDGKGYSSVGLRPPPRDFTQALFKFGGVPQGASAKNQKGEEVSASLPPDSELKRIVKGGLHGTAMLPWDITDQELDAAIQYIKAFPKRACVEAGGTWDSCKSRWETETTGAPVAAQDPQYTGDKKAQAIELGKKLYHAKAQCAASCHPNFVTHEELFKLVKEAQGNEMTAFSAEMYHSQPKDSEYCLEWKAGWKKVEERECAMPVRIVPPDFTRDDVRAGSTPADLFRTIGSGVGGAGMPPWKGTLTDEELWGLAYYVNSLVEIKGKPEAAALHAKL